MRGIIIFIIISSIVFFQEPALIPRNRFDAEIVVNIDVFQDTLTYQDIFLYQYKVRNLTSSEQAIRVIEVILSDSSHRRMISELGASNPQLRRGFLKVPRNPSCVYFSSIDSLTDVIPGDSIVVWFKSSLLPDISPFYIEGYAELPVFPEGEAPGFIPGYHDLTPYGPGKVYTTIGPGPLPPQDNTCFEYLE